MKRSDYLRFAVVWREDVVCVRSVSVELVLPFGAELTQLAEELLWVLGALGLMRPGLLECLKHRSTEFLGVLAKELHLAVVTCHTDHYHCLKNLKKKREFTLTISCQINIQRQKL